MDKRFNHYRSVILRISMIAGATLCASCASFDKQISIDALALAGSSPEEIRLQHGEPDFWYTARDDREYLGYRLWTTESSDVTMDRCSVIYVVNANGDTEASTVGRACHDHDWRTKRRSFNDLAEDLEGAKIPLQDIVSMLGTPDAYDLAGDGHSGYLLYDLGSATGTSGSGGPVGGGLSVSFSMTTTVGCKLTLGVEDGVVSEAEAGGGACFAWGLPVPNGMDLRDSLSNPSDG